MGGGGGGGGGGKPQSRGGKCPPERNPDVGDTFFIRNFPNKTTLASFLVPRPSPPPVFDYFLYVRGRGKSHVVGRHTREGWTEQGSCACNVWSVTQSSVYCSGHERNVSY